MCRRDGALVLARLGATLVKEGEELVARFPTA